MNAADQFAVYDSDLAGIEQEMPFPFRFGGKCLIGQQGENLDTLLGQDAGYLQQYDFVLVVRVSIYAQNNLTPPVAEDDIEINDPNDSKAWISVRIKSITRSPDGVSVVYGLKADN